MATYYVAKTGNDTTGDGSEGSPWLTIGKGTSSMASGDTLYVKAGTYAEKILDEIPSGGGSWATATTLAAYPGDAVTIQGTSAETIYFSTAATSSWIVVEGFDVDQNDVAGTVCRILGDSHHIRFKDLTVHNWGSASGFHFQSEVSDSTGAEFCEIVGCTLSDGGTSTLHHGIYLSWNTQDCLVEGNTISGMPGFGVHCYSTVGGNNRNIIKGNICHSNDLLGILIGSGADNLAYNNVCYSNGAGGIRVGFNTATESLVYNNTCYSNTLYGVWTRSDADATIIRNNILYNNSTSAIQDDGTNTVTSNNLTTDPSFVDADSNDVHLASTSSAINAGVDLSSVITDDFDGTTRPQGSAFDLGAFEYSEEAEAGVVGEVNVSIMIQLSRGRRRVSRLVAQ